MTMPEMTPEARATLEALQAHLPSGAGIPAAASSGEPTPLGKMTREEYLEAENIHLKMQGFNQKLQMLQVQVQNTLSERSSLEKEMNALRDKLSVKYGVDVSQAQIMPDGTIYKAIPTPGFDPGQVAAGVVPPIQKA